MTDTSPGIAGMVRARLMAWSGAERLGQRSRCGGIMNEGCEPHRPTGHAPMPKPLKHDPQWAKAKQLCRLNHAPTDVGGYGSSDNGLFRRLTVVGRIGCDGCVQ